MHWIAFTSQAAWYSFFTERRAGNEAVRRSTAERVTVGQSTASSFSGMPVLRCRLSPCAGVAVSRLGAVTRFMVSLLDRDLATLRGGKSRLGLDFGSMARQAARYDHA